MRGMRNMNGMRGVEPGMRAMRRMRSMKGVEPGMRDIYNLVCLVCELCKV